MGWGRKGRLDDLNDYRSNKRQCAVCSECGQRFILSAMGQSAHYYHLIREHGYSHDEAYDAVGDATIE